MASTSTDDVRRRTQHPLNSSVRTRSMTSSTSLSTLASAAPGATSGRAARPTVGLPRSHKGSVRSDPVGSQATAASHAGKEDVVRAGLRSSQRGGNRPPSVLGSVHPGGNTHRPTGQTATTTAAGGGMKRSGTAKRLPSTSTAGPRMPTRSTRMPSSSKFLSLSRPSSPAKPSTSSSSASGFPTSSAFAPAITSPLKRMPLSPKSPPSQNQRPTPVGAGAGPFDLTSPGKRDPMVFRSPGKSKPTTPGFLSRFSPNKHSPTKTPFQLTPASTNAAPPSGTLDGSAKRKAVDEGMGVEQRTAWLTVPLFGTSGSASKRPRSTSPPLLSSSPPRPTTASSASSKDGLASSSPLLRGDEGSVVEGAASRKKLKLMQMEADLVPADMHFDDQPVPDAMDVDEPARPPSSEGPDIAALELASPPRKEFNTALLRALSPPLTFKNPLARLPTISMTASTTPPGTPGPVSPSKGLSIQMATSPFGQTRISPIKEATMPTSIPLRSPSPLFEKTQDEIVLDRPDSSLSNASSSSSSSLLPHRSFEDVPPSSIFLSTSGGSSFLESIEEASPIKPSEAARLAAQSRSQAATERAAAAVAAHQEKNLMLAGVGAGGRISMLKSKYRGTGTMGFGVGAGGRRLSGIPVLAATGAGRTTASVPAFGSGALGARPSGIPRATSLTAITASTTAATSQPAAVAEEAEDVPAEDSAATTAEAEAETSKAARRTSMSQETTDRLAKLQAMLANMSSGGSVRPGTGEAGKPMTGGRPSLGGRLTSSASSSALATRSGATVSQPPAGGRPTGRRRSSSNGSLTQPVGSTVNAGGQVLSRSGAPLGQSLRASTNCRVSQILLPTAAAAALENGQTAGTEGPAATVAQATTVKRKDGPLKDVVAYVDVRTAEGDDAGQVFVEMLKGLGAKVMVRPTCPITHIIFKEGKPGTVDRWAGHPEPKPFIVGIGWVVRCRETMSHAAESPYIVEITREAVASKRRRSMEPKALALANAGLLSSSHLGPPPVASSRPNIAASIEQAKRKSLQFAPKIGSPLARRVYDASSLMNEVNADS